MYKLVILIEPLEDQQAFEDSWPEFLSHAERMPGLIREASSLVDAFLYGSREFIQIHELFFESRAGAHAALMSPHGKAAGALLQRITSGRLILFFADHKEDELVNIARYTGENDQTE
jgi:uncharacterized protein (TIGR02118 family)